MSGRVLAAAVIIAAFGPYIAPGIRTEQALVYIVAPFALLAIVGATKGLPRVLGSIATVWVVYAIVAGFGGIAPPYNSTPYDSGSLFAGLDNLALPIAVLVIAVALARRGDPVALVSTASWWVVVMMLANTVAAFLQFQGLADWSAWWTAEPGGSSVAQNAENNGRYSGLINQPAEAGLLYGIAALAAMYLWSTSRRAVLFVVLAVLTYGGLMTVSKVFLLVGLPIVIWQLFTLEGRVGRLVTVLLGGGALLIAAREGWLPGWAGGKQLEQIFPSGDRSFLRSVTASRFGETSTLESVINAVLETSPVFGMGALGLREPYDNGFVEALIYAGVVGVICYGLTLLLWAAACRDGMKSKERSFLVGLVILSAGASMGLPALTTNRGATVLWFLLTLLTLATHIKNKDHAGSGSERELQARSESSRVS